MPASKLPARDRAADQIVAGLLQLAQALRAQSWRNADEAGLSPTQREILSCLESADGPLRLSALADALSITSATTSDAVRSLQEKGLVHKRRAVDDGRALAIALTSAGRRLARAAHEWPAFLTQLVDRLRTTDQGALLRGLVKVVKGLQQDGRLPAARMCVTCTFFRACVRSSRTKPHRCEFVDAPLGDSDLRLACRDHREAQPSLAAANWARFDRAM